MLRFKLHQVSMFKPNKKIESFIGKEFDMEEVKNIGDTFIMNFQNESIKDKAMEIYKDKSGGDLVKRLCLVGSNGVYIIEFIKEVKK